MHANLIMHDHRLSCNPFSFGEDLSGFTKAFIEGRHMENFQLDEVNN